MKIGKRCNSCAKVELCFPNRRGYTRHKACKEYRSNNKRVLDIKGKKFGRLKALEFLRLENNAAVWLFECSCGNKKELLRYTVQYGNTKFKRILR